MNPPTMTEVARHATGAPPEPEIRSPLEQMRSRGRVRGVIGLLGPAFVAAVAYIDPGNFATNIAGGAKYGYMLLWVIVAANLMAMPVLADRYCTSIAIRLAATMTHSSM